MGELAHKTYRDYIICNVITAIVGPCYSGTWWGGLLKVVIGVYPGFQGLGEGWGG